MLASGDLQAPEALALLRTLVIEMTVADKIGAAAGGPMTAEQHALLRAEMRQQLLLELGDPKPRREP